MISIALVDHTNKYAPEELARVATALTEQVRRDFSVPPPLGYGVSATVRPCGAVGPLPHEWVLGLFEHPDQPGALGYHDETPAGLPVMKVFPLLDPTQPWSVTASHEVLETLADPNLCKGAQNIHSGRWYALEVCDPVEDDTYEIGGVAVSNFVTPAYFEPPKELVRLDFMGLVKHPGEVRPGGYSQYWTGRSWKTVEHSGQKMSAARAAKREVGRGARRAGVSRLTTEQPTAEWLAAYGAAFALEISAGTDDVEGAHAAARKIANLLG